MGKQYDRMLTIQQEVSDINGALALMGWDQETYMPAKGASTRGRQLATLSGIAHERFTSTEMGSAIEEAGSEELTVDQQVNQRELAWTYSRSKRLPTALVKDLAETSSIAIQAWRDARENSDFPAFVPHVKKLLALQTQVAEAIGYAEEPYDALLEDYEPGTSTREIAETFEALRTPLVALVDRIRESGVSPRTDFLERSYPIEDQRKFGVMVTERMGFDYEAGRLDISAHPFCTHTGVHDVRMTTRYTPTLPTQSLFGIIHEAGHGLYEQGQDPSFEGLPRAQAVSLGIHESQSRMWENLVGRSRPFWNHFFPEIVKTFPEQLSDVSEEEFYAAINNVTPSLIRVEADEVTYNLHILLRFEIERGLFTGTFAVEDLPAVWNEKMQDYLGIAPDDNREGVLQDIHWSYGSFGYFPTYSLGNLYASQFFAKACADIPDLTDKISSGNLLPLREWLRTHIHDLGMTYRASDLVVQVTGEPLNADYFVSYLNEKFGALYGL
ncbi:MAG: carboxypeptidase M32 [Candidatus Latescibacteria bacterium]|jgi:carboxypeptidase Taq|nr:carboxypeptidase M32 [Candidatus Latescibacterota bacterium]